MKWFDDYKGVAWLLYLFGFVLFLIFFASALPFFKTFDFDLTGKIGDSLGGFTAPIIGMLAVITTFLAFIAQYKANEEIQKQFKHERFETKFYELLKLHQHNVSDIEIDNRFKGRKAFVRMYDEIRFIYAFLLEKRIYWNHFKEGRITDNPEVLMEFVYTIFFFGVDEVRKGFKTNFVFKHDIHTPFAIQFTNDLYELRKESRVDKKYKLVANSPSMPDVKWSPSYKPFGGHVSKLGHYYRHLYQLVKFVAGNDSLELSFDEKYEYIKTVRAQLSNHEQTLIYFNSFFNAGEIWWTEKHHNPKKILENDKGQTLSYFLDYRIIKNLPFNLTRFGPDPENTFASKLRERGLSKEQIKEEKKDLFEWIGG